MLKKLWMLPLVFIIAAFPLSLLTGCDSGGGGDPEITDDVVAAATQMFEFTGMVMEADGDYTEFALMGMDVTESGVWSLYPYSISLSGEDIDPDGDETDLIINSFDFTMTLDDDPVWEIGIDYYADVENWIASIVRIDAVFKWDAGNSPDSSSPDTATGTITVDGITYDIEKVMEKIDFDEIGGDEEPDPK